MKIDSYPLKVESGQLLFEFVSEGPKGSIHKVIKFQKTYLLNVFNLSLTDKDPISGKTDDMVVSDNKDTDKVLATVVAALYMFFNNHPSALVYAEGSTPSRTRLYRMKIAKFYKEITREFNLYGEIAGELTPFEINKEYTGFLTQRKFN